MNTIDSTPVTTANEPKLHKHVNAEVIERPNFGNGRFASAMGKLYDESQALLAFTPQQAEKFARQAASDAGSVLQNASASIKIGKANADGKASIEDASKVKGITLTNSLHVVRALQWIGDAGKNGISYGKTAWQLSPPLAKYAEGLKED